MIILIALLIASLILALYLVILTDIVVLLLGGLCFLCGVFYTFGPIPISRQPWGEVFSGVFYGFFIPFILLYINMPQGTYLVLSGNLNTINITLEVFPIITVILLSILPVCSTANIMLANNICDLEHDVKVKRYTLPYYLGVKKALFLFAGIYYICYLALLIMTILRILSPICLLFMITIVPVHRNIRVFFNEQDKTSTFIVSIKNYLIIMGTITVLIFFSGLIS